MGKVISRIVAVFKEVGSKQSRKENSFEFPDVGKELPSIEEA